MGIEFEAELVYSIQGYGLELLKEAAETLYDRLDLDPDEPLVRTDGACPDAPDAFKEAFPRVGVQYQNKISGRAPYIAYSYHGVESDPKISVRTSGRGLGHTRVDFDNLTAKETAREHYERLFELAGRDVDDEAIDWFLYAIQG